MGGLLLIKKIACIFISILFITMIFSIVHAEPLYLDRKVIKNFPTSSCDFFSEDVIDDIGWYTSLVLDNNNFPHISYYDYTNGDLKYAYWTGSEWNIQSVDIWGNVGRYSSITLNKEGHPHISYYDYTNGDLKYAYWTGSSWSIKKVDGDGKVGLYTSIALDSSGLPHISYCDYTKRALKYAHWDGNSWNKKIIDDTGIICMSEYFGDYTSIAIDSKDYVHISYCDSGKFDLKYAYQYDSTWGIEVVDSYGDVGQYSSIVLDDNDNPHIGFGYFGHNNDLKFDLKYAVKTNDNWNVETVDSEGDIRKWISLKLDTENLPHISYYDYYEGSLKYTFNSGSDWVFDTIESEGSTGCFNSLCLDSNNNPSISFYNWGGKALKYASLKQNDWDIQTIEIDDNSDFLDQKQSYCCGWADEIAEGRPMAQSFIPTYSVLTRVELMIVRRNNPGGITISIRDDLDGENLISIYFSSNEIAEDMSWKNIDFQDIKVNLYQTYYIVCESEDTENQIDTYWWYFGIYDPYPDGNAWIQDGNWKVLSISGFPDQDIGFKTFGLNTDIPGNPTIDGPIRGKVRSEITYKIQSSDPDGDDISYCIDWGEGDLEYTNFYPSGEKISVNHTWNKIKTYLIRVKAIDIHGTESGWTTLEVSIPGNKIFFKNTILGFLWHIFNNPIYKRYLKILSSSIFEIY